MLIKFIGAKPTFVYNYSSTYSDKMSNFIILYVAGKYNKLKLAFPSSPSNKEKVFLLLNYVLDSVPLSVNLIDVFQQK